MALFYEKGRLETVWAMLRTYGYNNDLRLSDEVLSEVNFTHSQDQVSSFVAHSDKKGRELAHVYYLSRPACLRQTIVAFGFQLKRSGTCGGLYLHIGNACLLHGRPSNVSFLLMYSCLCTLESNRSC